MHSLVAFFACNFLLFLVIVGQWHRNQLKKKAYLAEGSTEAECP